MSAKQAQFPALSRLLHWLMAIMVLTMLFIGIGMVSSETNRYHVLVSIHEPLGIAIFILVIIRFINRLVSPPPPLPDTMPVWQRLAAEGSHFVLYGLMFIMPLVGWGMLSAEPYPILLFGSVHLPPILPQNAALYAGLRQLHTALAYLFFATFLAHFGAALLHGLIRRDGVFESMASVSPSRPLPPPPPPVQPSPTQTLPTQQPPS
jgi:cytochrome b561